MNAIPAQPGWTAIKAIPNPSSAEGFKIEKLPLIGWNVDQKTVKPITPIGTLETGFVASIDPDGNVYALETVFVSIYAWLKYIQTNFQQQVKTAVEPVGERSMDAKSQIKAMRDTLDGMQ